MDVQPDLAVPEDAVADAIDLVADGAVRVAGDRGGPLEVDRLVPVADDERARAEAVWLRHRRGDDRARRLAPTCLAGAAIVRFTYRRLVLGSLENNRRRPTTITS